VKKDTFFPLVYLVLFATLLGYRVVRSRAGASRVSVAG
jgi:DMSO/TMAO reductase YedYZ heme-binding membrane subunit